MSGSPVIPTRPAPGPGPAAGGEVRGVARGRAAADARRDVSTGDVGRGFDRALEKALESADLKLSRHARDRIRSRRIRIDESDVGRLSDAIETLRGKGGRISLLLMGDTTFVTNVKNRTVITAVDRYGEAERVFTQIDSAAVIDKA